MVSSLDGSIVVAGVSGGLGNDTDSAIFAALRDAADVILVGSATVAAEAYGPPRRAGQRIAVVSGSGRLDTDTELFRSGLALVVTTTDAPELGVPTIRAGQDTVDLAAALSLLGGSMVLCEGGGRLNGSMVAADLIDELCWTISPALVAGSGPRLASGDIDARRSMRLAFLGEQDSFLYARYVRSIS
jgi:riboflavin biosynthesis pyrimidine reductase